LKTILLILKPTMKVLGNSKARMSGPLEVSGDKRTNKGWLGVRMARLG
jgi:hypothetical protein